jgi:hypothetical protein
MNTGARDAALPLTQRLLERQVMPDALRPLKFWPSSEKLNCRLNFAAIAPQRQPRRRSGCTSCRSTVTTYAARGTRRPRRRTAAGPSIGVADEQTDLVAVGCEGHDPRHRPVSLGRQRIGRLHVRVLPLVVQITLIPVRVGVRGLRLGNAQPAPSEQWSLHSIGHYCSFGAPRY